MSVNLTCWDAFLMAICDVAAMICFLEPDAARRGNKFFISLTFHQHLHCFFLCGSQSPHATLSASALAYRTLQVHHNKVSHSAKRRHFFSAFGFSLTFDGFEKKVEGEKKTLKNFFVPRGLKKKLVCSENLRGDLNSTRLQHGKRSRTNSRFYRFLVESSRRPGKLHRTHRFPLPDKSTCCNCAKTTDGEKLATRKKKKSFPLRPPNRVRILCRFATALAASALFRHGQVQPRGAKKPRPRRCDALRRPSSTIWRAFLGCTANCRRQSDHNSDTFFLAEAEAI